MKLFCVNTARFKKELYLRILNEACLFVNQINSSGLRVVSYFIPLRSVDISLLRCTRQLNESKFLKNRARTTPEVEMRLKIARTGNKSCKKHLFLSRNFAR